MDLNKLNFLVALADCRSFTVAAERLFTTQSSVSKVIISLEEEVGIKLVDRSKRRISITDQGKVMVRYAKGILASYNTMMREISGYASEQAGEVKIAVIPTMAHYNITRYLAEFHNLYPSVTLTIEEADCSSALSELEVMNCDLAFIRSEHLDPQKYRKIVLFQDRLVAILSNIHQYASRESIGILELEKEPFLLISQTNHLYDVVIDVCRKAGFMPSIYYSGKHHENIVSMVKDNMGVSLMMQKSAEFFNTEHIVILPLEEEVFSELSLVRIKKRDLVPSANLFWSYIQSIRPSHEYESSFVK